MLIALVALTLAAPVTKATEPQAQPATTQLSTGQYQGVQDITVPLPHGELSAETAAEQAQRDRANAPKTVVEVGASTYEPKNIQTYSQLPNPTEFKLVGLPALTVNVIRPFFDSVSYKMGVNFVEMERQGSLNGTTVDQTAYIPSLRAGLEFSPSRFEHTFLRPYLCASLLPTMVITSRSAFDGGIADLGMAYEFGGGLLLQFSKSVSLNLGVTETLGKVKSSDLQGFSAIAALRIL